ncbi:uncharacterized protein LOC121383556 [Gigantopelta aegis]|uniref:uncharacterized protein LOC121383556 n=1 Tax=Gigantopelta aegis TaxID=1735272 RepID=UPI001B889955|nr:uncharacterized protein LOC121383556 [Gigantopelta aegis]
MYSSGVVKRTQKSHIFTCVFAALRRPYSTSSPGGSADSFDSAIYLSSESVEPYTLILEMNSTVVQEIIPASYPTQVWWSLKNEKDLPGIPDVIEIYKNEQNTILEYHIDKSLSRSLADLCKNRLYDSSDTEYLRYLQTTAVNLRDLHSRGWVHGEIQTSNILAEATQPLSAKRKVKVNHGFTLH